MKKDFLKVLFYNLFFIFCLLVILESLIRIFNLSQIQGYKAEIYFDKIHKLRPKSEGIVLGEKFFTDNLGFRIPSKEYSYESKKKILFLGDSVTFGVGIKEESTFVGKFRKNLTEHSVFNLALFGYQINEYSAQINDLKSFNPIDKILIFLTLNDVYITANIQINQKSENTYNKSLKILNFNFIKKINTYLRNKSYLYTFFKGNVIDPPETWFNNTLAYYKKNDLEFVRTFFIDFTDFVNKNGIKSYIFILPYEYQTRDCKKELLLPQRKIIELSKDISNNFYDLTANFCNYEKPKKLFLKYDPMHLSKEGHNLVFNLTKKIIDKNE